MESQQVFSVLPVAAPEVLAIFCGDPRIQTPVNAFIHQTLGLTDGMYVPFTIPGGTASFTEASALPKEFKYVKEAVEFYLLRFPSIKRIVLINHEDCAKYQALCQKIGPYFRLARDIPQRQLDDLALIEKLLSVILSHPVSFERYYAKFANPEHTEMVFEKH
jgi:hypothetical protein